MLQIVVNWFSIMQNFVYFNLLNENIRPIRVSNWELFMGYPIIRIDDVIALIKNCYVYKKTVNS